MNLSDNIRFLKGVGPTKELLLNKLGIYSIKDLIEFYPRNYEYREEVKVSSQFVNNEYTLFFATICTSMNVRYIRKNLSIYSCFGLDNNGKMIKLVWFNQKYIRTKILEGNRYLFFGKTCFDGRCFAVESPEVYSPTMINDVKGIFPIYTLTSGITNKYLMGLVKEALKEEIKFENLFSNEFMKKYNLLERGDALKKIHFPKSEADIKLSRNTFIFEELFLLQLALRLIKNNDLVLKKVNLYNDLYEENFTSMLPFELTGAQKRVISEIKNDLKSNKIMNRLVQGDVGSGKTMIAAVACFFAVKNGYQAAIMAPTAILATQHYEELKEYFARLNINVRLLTSSTKKKEKNEILEELKVGEIDILIGTHAILEDNIEFCNLSLVVTDEQHRFGVKQRIKLTNKGRSVDTIVMTATPIPRSLAVVLYGDLDISIVDELPRGRIPIKTCIATRNQEERVNNFIKKQIALGRQIYVVCPLVEESEKLDLNSVENVYERYSKEDFKEFRVEYLHGKMPPGKKDEIMKSFKEKNIDILISTSVIEVGISVPNATVMVIEDADRFGLASLHQLRGRVGRGSFESFCILKTSNNSTKSRERLAIMRDSNNGFEIAEKDLELRGPGDFFGIRQSGLQELKIADLLKDINVLKITQEAVKENLRKDATLSSNENKNIRKKIIEDYGEYLKNIGM